MKNNWWAPDREHNWIELKGLKLPVDETCSLVEKDNPLLNGLDNEPSDLYLVVFRRYADSVWKCSIPTTRDAVSVVK